MVFNVLIICMSVLVNIMGVATWAHKQIVPHISHIVPHHQCGSHCTDKFVPHDQRGSHCTNKPHFEESHCPTAQRRHCRGEKKAQYSTQSRHTLPEGTDLPKLPKRRLYISWIIRRQKGNPKGLDLKAHEAYFNNDSTDESFVSYTRGASQSLCD